MDSRLENGLDLYEEVINQGAEQRETSMSNEADMKLNDRFQATKGYHSHTPDLKIPDLMNWNTLGKAPMQLLFNTVDKVINESIERKNGDVPDPVACLLRKLVQEIKLRISSHADKIKSQNILAKSREGKYQSKVRALEALAVGSAEENQVIMRKLRQIRAENVELEEKKKHDQQDAVRLLREIDERDAEITVMKQEIGKAKTSYEKRCLELENEVKDTKSVLEKKIEELECHLKDSKKKVKQLEQLSEIQKQKLRKKELLYQNYIGSHSNLIQDLRMDLDTLRRDALRTKKSYTLEFQNLGVNLKELIDAADNYDAVLSENRRLYNEVQDLKGNIRVYCRIRPFLPGQNEKQTTIEYIGENGELVVTNALKQGKDNRRLFKFNKVFAQMASQEEIFKDTQPLVRSVLDGYNVCIFAYGQTGSGKTYTMSGPNISSQKDWGVNYRALHDLFQISQSRRTSILYEVCVQMVEIYNEQVRDLLASDGPQKRLGIRSISQTNALAVPEASMYPVNSTSDVLELMNIGLMNRAVGATALNERSSRSHSILTVHVRGTELKSNSVLRGCLHLVDLAGSERVDRSEATGDRLREAQHINKSLSALGDVVFALAQKSSHVPYRNSKLTQVLQSSLGGQAKTLMFVQLNPDLESHSETISTLKFAERVSGVELGAARSNKEGRDLRDLMEQVSFMKEVIARKDEEIEHLRLMKVNGCIEQRIMNTEKGSPSSPSSPRGRFVEPTRDIRSFLGTKSSGHSVGGFSYSDKLPENSYRRSSTVAPRSALNANDEADLLGFRDADSEDRLSDISDSGLSMGTGADGESTLFREVSKPAETASKRPSITSKFPKLLRKQASAPSSLSAHPRSSTKVVSSSRKAPPAVANGLPARPKPKPLKKWP